MFGLLWETWIIKSQRVLWMLLVQVTELKKVTTLALANGLFFDKTILVDKTFDCPYEE